MAVLQQHVDTSTEERACHSNTESDAGDTDEFLGINLPIGCGKVGGAMTKTLVHQTNLQSARSGSLKALVQVVNMVNLLIQNCINMEARDMDGMTALHHAAKYGNPRTVFA